MVDMKKMLSKSILDLVNSYQYLPIAGKLISCPYFKNRAGVRVGYKVAVGKGTPHEIAEEVEIRSKINKYDLNNVSIYEIRQFMEKQGLGVDCSGFVVQLLNVIDSKVVIKLAKRNFLKNPYRALISRMRPIENISADRLTSGKRVRKIEDLNKIEPGNLIRTRRGKHLLIVIGTYTGEDDKINKVVYAHATLYYGKESGVRIGEINITSLEKHLKDQDWQEKDENENNPTYQGYLDDDGSNGIYKLIDEFDISKGVCKA